MYSVDKRWSKHDALYYQIKEANMEYEHSAKLTGHTTILRTVNEVVDKSLWQQMTLI